MFKKRSKPKALKKRSADNDDEDDDEGESEVVVSEEAASAQAVKRRRQVLTGLQYKRGVDAATLGSSQKATGKHNRGDNSDPEEDDSKLPSNTKMTNESQVWKERHEKAMEDYIESKMHQEKQETSDDNPIKEEANSTSVTSKDQLFQQLAETAKKLSGKDVEASEQTLQHQEVLRSGAATAMAEVILPSPFSTQMHRKPMSRSNKDGATVGGGGESSEEGAGGRVGFAAARGIQETKPREQSADEKAYKNFVQRQRR